MISKEHKGKVLEDVLEKVKSKSSYGVKNTAVRNDSEKRKKRSRTTL